MQVTHDTEGLTSCDSPWQRRSGDTSPSLVPESTGGSAPPSSQSTTPFLTLSQSDSFTQIDTRSPNVDQSEQQKQITALSQSIETTNFEDDTQLTSISEDQTMDDFPQSLPCDHLSENFDLPCEPESESHDQNQPDLFDNDLVQYDSDDGLLCNEENEYKSQTFASHDQSHDQRQRSHDQTGSDVQMSHDITDQSTNISVEVDKDNILSMRNTTV